MSNLCLMQKMEGVVGFGQQSDEYSEGDIEEMEGESDQVQIEA